MERKDRDLSSTSNGRLLSEILAPIPVLEIAFLGPNPLVQEAIKNNAKKLQKTLAQILA